MKKTLLLLTLLLTVHLHADKLVQVESGWYKELMQDERVIAEIENTQSIMDEFQDVQRTPDEIRKKVFDIALRQMSLAKNKEEYRKSLVGVSHGVSLSTISQNYAKESLIEILAKQSDAIIEGGVRKALRVGMKPDRLAQLIAHSVAYPWMVNENIDLETRVRIAKGINYGVPYKFIGSIMKNAPEARAPAIIEHISYGTSYGTLSSATEAGVRKNLEDLVYAATDAFVATVIKVAKKQEAEDAKLILFSRHSTAGVLAGAVTVLSNYDLPLGQLGVVEIAQVTGEVKVFNPTTMQEPQLATTESELHQGYRIETSVDSEITLMFSNGTVITLLEDSVLDIDKFTQETFSQSYNLELAKNEPSPSHTKLSLEKGDFVFDVKRLLDESSMVFKTPLGETQIKGTSGKLKSGINGSERTQAGVDLVTGEIVYTHALGEAYTVNGGSSFTEPDAFSQESVMTELDTSVQTSIDATFQEQKISTSGISAQNLLSSREKIGQAAVSSVSARVSNIALSVAEGVSSAGFGSNEVDGDIKSALASSVSEGIALGSIKSARNQNLNTVTVAENISSGTIYGAISSQSEGEKSLAVMNAIQEGHKGAIAAFEAEQLFSPTELNQIELALNKPVAGMTQDSSTVRENMQNRYEIVLNESTENTQQFEISTEVAIDSFETDVSSVELLTQEVSLNEVVDFNISNN